MTHIQLNRHVQSLSKSLNSMRMDMRFSDLSFVCHDRRNNRCSQTINGHQAVIGNFSKLMNSLFSIAKQKQPYERVVISIDSVDFTVVEKLFEYIYVGSTVVTDDQKDKMIDLCQALQLDLPLTACSPTVPNLPSIQDKLIYNAPKISDKNQNCSWFDSKELSNKDLYAQWRSCNQQIEFSPKVELSDRAGWNESLDTTVGYNMSQDSSSMQQIDDLTRITNKNSLGIESCSKKPSVYEAKTKKVLSLVLTRLSVTDMCTKPHLRKRNSKQFEKYVKKSSRLCNRALYKCNLCVDSPQRDNGLIKYKTRAHKKCKPYECEECPYFTVDKYHLKRHKESVHYKLKPYECEECTYSTGNKSHLNRHIEMIHYKNWNLKFKKA